MNADSHLDAAAYALDAMPADEALEFQSHLEGCESCSAELVGFLETAALLGAAQAERPPAGLRAAVMARVAVTPQLPPITEAGPSTTAPGEAQAPSRRLGAHRASGTAQRWYRRPGALLAAAVAALVVGGGAIFAVNQVGQNDQVAQTPEQCVAGAADQRQITPAQGSGGTVKYAPSCGAALLEVTGLPALPSGRTYQLWALAGQQPRSLGVLPDAAAGKPQVVGAQTQPGETVVAITAEPAGGSQQPTLPILWRATLQS